jgi:hypothetical protein
VLPRKVFRGGARTFSDATGATPAEDGLLGKEGRGPQLGSGARGRACSALAVTHASGRRGPSPLGSDNVNYRTR